MELTSAKCRRYLLGTTLLLLGLIPLAMADEEVLTRLEHFSKTLNSFSASFEQTLYDADSAPLKSSSGTVLLKRPGKFIWKYAEPEAQEIIADGARIWLYDKDLEQVTVNDIDDRVSGSPLVLLMGTKPLSDEFTVTPLGESDGIDWVELKPLETDTDFEVVYIGLNEAGLAAMELRDNFGQATQIIFSDFQADIPIDDATFEFIPPAGVDVIGADGG
ncbi:MAG: outer membrane lipoprotein chaperone LolA [Gammaproteobacteria bacterium]|nr:outer membrane lipoprotein chaperone LolA [Gammaproteobacteria bacterium]